MKIKNLLTKTLLAMGMLCVGVNGAWADLVPTTTTCNFENSETLFTASGRMTGSNVVDPSDNTNHVYSITSASNAGNVAPGAFAYYDFSSQAKTAVKVDISFDCNVPETAGQLKISVGDAEKRTSSIFTNTGAWSYSNTGAIFAFGTERGKLNGKTNENYASHNGNAIGSTTTLKANAVLGLWVNVSLSVDVVNKKVSYTIKNKSTDAELISVTNADFYSSEATTCTQLDIQTGVNSVTAYVDNVSITSYVDESEKYSDYTIKYMYGETEIKASRTVEDIKVGTTTSILDSDKAAIWYGEPSEKYIYDSDNASQQTVAEDGSTVVTVSFRKANVESYTVNFINSADNSVLIADAITGNVIEGESATVYYHKAIKVGDVWYVRAQNNNEPYYGINVVAGTNTVSYTENTDVKYFFEVEDLPVVKVGSYGGWRNDGMATRSSGGQAPRHYGKNYAYTGELAGGIYTLTMNARNQSSSGSDNVILAIMDANGTITTLDKQFAEWPKAQTAEHTVISVSIPDGAKFVLKCGDNNSNLNMDFLMFARTGDYTVPSTISSAGWATLYTDKALDFSSTGLTAYTATVANNNTVTLAEVDDVPANTGVVLKGDANTYNIPVIANSTTAKGSLEGSATDATAFDAFTGNTLYILTLNGTKVQFNPMTSGSLAAGKAYLKLPTTTTARTLSVAFADDTTTGINNINVNNNDNWFDLQGRRVNQPSKGLYIMNGKKIVIK